MIDPNLKFVAKKWQQETEDWLRKNHYSEIKVYKHIGSLKERDCIAKIKLESIKYNRVILLSITGFNRFSKFKILGQFKTIDGWSNNLNEAATQIPGCNYREEDYSFQMTDNPEKNIQELNRICQNFTNLLQTHLLPIIEGKAWYSNYIDFRD